MPKYFEVRRFSAPTGVWTPITVPIECARIVIENGSASVACAIRTDKDDSDTEKSIPASLELTIQSIAATFQVGSTVLWANPASGTSTLIVSYTR